MMSHLLDENDELLASSAREMTLGTGSILSIFFGLVLLCGLFFGFGYNVGHKAGSTALLASTAAASSDEVPSSAASKSFDNFKPAAGSATKSLASSTINPRGATEDAVPTVVDSTAPKSEVTIPKPSAAAHLPAPLRPGAPTASASQAPEEAPTQSATPAGAGTFFVQVAAVSHAEDATLLMGALRARGYTVAQRTEPSDKLFHIQVGPFASKPAADAMRQRLQTDGYNAIIK